MPVTENELPDSFDISAMLPMSAPRYFRPSRRGLSAQIGPPRPPHPPTPPPPPPPPPPRPLAPPQPPHASPALAPLQPPHASPTPAPHQPSHAPPTPAPTHYAPAASTPHPPLAPPTPHSVARILLLVDGMAAFRTAHEFTDRGRLFETFTRLATIGRGLGIHTVVTTDRSGAIPPSLHAAFPQRLTLRLTSP